MSIRRAGLLTAGRRRYRRAAPLLALVVAATLAAALAGSSRATPAASAGTTTQSTTPGHQIVALIEKTLAYADQPALRAPLKARLEAAASALVARNTPVACTALNLYSAAVKLAPRSLLTAGEKAELLSDATAIQAAVGCLPRVSIDAPSTGSATNAATLEVRVSFEVRVASLGHTDLSELVVSLDGTDIARRQNPRGVKQGTHVFAVDVSRLGEGSHALRARGYQGSANAGLVGWSQPVTVVVDRTPPELALTAPADGSVLHEPRVVLEGTASDATSGVASLTCAGSAAAVAASFSCEAALVEGANELVARAVDRAGNARERRVTVEHVPGGFAGRPGDPALDATEDVFTQGAYAAADEITDGVIRTQLELVFAKDATVGAVNALLRRIDGQIVSQREGVLIAVVRIPDPGSLTALEHLLAGLAGDPALRDASEVTLPEPEELPETIDITMPAHLNFIRHQLAVRAHAAWNARFALFTLPTLVVGDHFGDGPPGDHFDVTETPADFGTGSPRSHGYHVLGIATGTFSFAGGSVAADAVTGMFPTTIPLAVADARAGLGSAALDDRLLELIEDAPGNAVLNTSMGSACETPADAVTNCTVAAATEEALRWIERVRGTNPGNPAANLEGKFLHATSAGNIPLGVVLPLGADVSSKWTAAALLALVDPDSGATVPNLTNTLVVENFSATSTQPFQPDCLAPSSEVGGTIAGIGTDVHSLADPTTATATKTGTSMATPQVAGLAAYVWALNPGLGPAQLAALLRRTGQLMPGCGLVIDAYAAVLAADEGNPAQRARRAILDAADDNAQEGSNSAFDQRDIELFLDELTLGDGVVDYGRFDLNGDGRTGGDEREELDLDRSGTAQGIVEQEIEGATVQFDESGLTDIEVLCYYAYSDLYTPGNPDRRAELLGLDRCLPVDIDVRFPSTIAPGQNAVLTVTATRRDFSVGQPGIVIELTPTGGTVDRFVGVTSTLGLFQTNARLFAGQGVLTIEVVARAGEGGPELARMIVRASANTPFVGFFTGTLVLAGYGAEDGCYNGWLHIEGGRSVPDRFGQTQGGVWTHLVTQGNFTHASRGSWQGLAEQTGPDILVGFGDGLPTEITRERRPNPVAGQPDITVVTAVRRQNARTGTFTSGQVCS